MIGQYKKETTPIMIVDNRCGKRKHMSDIDVNMPISTKIQSFKPF